MDAIRLLRPEEAAELLGVTRRRMLRLPVEQVRLGQRTIRYRLRDVCEFAGIEDPTLWHKGDQ
jgi:predicted DNA-binding transcriptional regulator AlpA